MLGMARDSIEVLKSAIQYLEIHKAKPLVGGQFDTPSHLNTFSELAHSLTL
jgi:hypothetical protein